MAGITLKDVQSKMLKSFLRKQRMEADMFLESRNGWRLREIMFSLDSILMQCTNGWLLLMERLISMEAMQNLVMRIQIWIGQME
ncbi:hypothetical protein CIY_23620 [Butyrivibrio fibrisolvens 16/4]|nr:hypothetical protein CIY_23620 [Butyrivibrio fibrisolvens 16/4]